MKKKKNRNKPPLKPIVSCRPRERIVIDYFSLNPDRWNYTYGLIMIDSFTKFVWSKGRTQSTLRETILQWERARIDPRTMIQVVDNFCRQFFIDKR